MAHPLIIPDVASLPEYEGTDLGVTGWHDIDQAKIDTFAEATGDHQWIHVDPERAAAESPFGATVAHGYMTLSLALVLLPELVEVSKLSQIVNIGLDKRFGLFDFTRCGKSTRCIDCINYTSCT